MWKFLYRQSKSKPPELQSGYSLLLPVPGDLPVFLKIALEGCNALASEELLETIILPDRPSRQLESLLHIWAKRYSVSPLRLLNPHPLESVLAGIHSIPLIDLQLMRGVRATQASHALVQLVGDFVIEPDFRRSQYRVVLEPACTQHPEISNDSSTDRGPVYHGAIDVQRLNRSPFWHPLASAIAASSAEKHTSNTVVQFPGLLPVYRRYQNSTGPFEDSEFYLLLMRLLVDAYDQSGRSYQLPLIDDLTKGITDPTARITYCDTQTRQGYPLFRQKVLQIIGSGLLDPMKAAIMQDELSLFERMFGAS